MLTAVADPDVAKAARLAGRYQAAAFGDAAQMMRSGAVEAVVIASPDALHAEHTVGAAAARLHILVEKPMALTLRDCGQMIAAAAEAGVTLAVGHVQRFLPAVRAGLQMLAGGAIGVPVLALDRRSARYEDGTRPQWFFDPALAGGGITANLGAHSIDKLVQLTGRRVQAAVAAWHRHPGNVATDAVALLRLDGGLPATVILTGTGLPDAEVTEIVGTQGALRVSRAGGAQVFQEGREIFAEPWPDDSIATAFTCQLAEFVAAVASRRAPAVDGEYGRDVIRAVHMMAGAAQSQTMHGR